MKKEPLYDPNIPKQDRKAYISAKAQAKYRREEWAFTIESWLQMWEESGVKEHRGSKIWQYSMVRLDEIEAWGPHNCIIIPRRMHFKKRCYVEFFNYPNVAWQPKHDVRYKK